MSFEMSKHMVFLIFVSSTLANPTLYYGIQPGVAPYLKLLSDAPIGPDGRVVDTPEVTAAKVQHEAAQVNQRIKLADEAAKSADPVLDTTTDPAAILETTVAATMPIPVDIRGKHCGKCGETYG